MKTNKQNQVTGRSGFSRRLQYFVVDHPWLCILGTLLFVAMTAAGLKNFQFDNDPYNMFPHDDEGMIQLQEIESTFTKDDNVVFVVHPKNNNIFTRENLAMLEALTEKAWQVPRTLRVDSLTNFQHTEVQGDDLVVHDLVENAESLSDEEIARIREIALSDPAVVKNVVSEKGHAATVNVTVIADDYGGREAPMVMAGARKIEKEFRERYPDVEFMISGHIAFKNASKETTETEMRTTTLYSGIAITLCLVLMLRSLTHVLITYVIITLSILIAAGTIAWCGVDFSPVMGGAPAIILTLAVADSIHLLLGYQMNIRNGLGKREAMLESLRVNMQPVLLTSVTTAIGFLFLNTTKSPPFADMANFVSVGVVAAWLLTIILLPALVMVCPVGNYRAHVSEHPLLNALFDGIIRYRKPVFVVSTIVFVGLASLSVRNQLNDVWVEYFDKTYEVRVATEFMTSEITGHHRVQYAFPSTGPGGIMEPEYMEGLDRFAQWARQQPKVMFVSSFSDTIKRLNRDMHGGDPDYYRIPDDRALISQYALMYQLSLPEGLGLENQIDISQSSVRVNVLLGMATAKELLDFELNSRQWIAENLPAYMHTRGTGFDILLGDLSAANGRGMLVGTALALVTVSLLIALALKSVRYGFISILPTILPAAISFGIWSVVDGYIGISVSIVACMTLGIVIDNVVHILSKYLLIRKDKGLSALEGARYAFHTVGSALIATTVVLAANFGAMATSHYYPNASMGLLTAITVGVALVVSFVFFVPLLIFVDQHKEGKMA